ncbi:MAG: RHS repeat-associated core domain-containing protein, partial [Candidatus Omnitrophota bacterium]
GRLTHEDKKDSSNNVIFSRDYSYDNAGNRTSETRDGVSVTLTYNNANQLTSRVTYSQTITYTYDNNGNLAQEVSNLTGTKTFAYEYENRPWRVTTAMPAATIYYGYSGDGRRTSTNVNGTVVKYIYDGLTPLIERDPSDNILATYTKIPSAPGGIGGLISSNDGTNTYYYHDSNLGNVNQMTNSAGAVVRTYDYDAFGYITAISGTVTTKYRYKTKEYSPETGLVFFGARYYNPLIGRFTTKDPSGMVDGPNVYLYCNNDPVNKYDPWGLDAVVFIAHSEAYKYGHIAIAIGNSSTGWDYYSQDGPAAGGGKWEFYESYDQMINAKSARYDESYCIPSTTEQDERMKEYARNNLGNPYNAQPFSPNRYHCGDLVSGTLKAGGISAGKEGMGNIPNNLFKEIKKANPKKRK